jgi:hypothetical protein
MKKPASASNARRARNEIQSGLDTRSHISSGPTAATHLKPMTAFIHNALVATAQQRHCICRAIHWQINLERGNSGREARLRLLIGLRPVPRSPVGRERGK